MKSTVISHIGKRNTNQDLTLVKKINGDSCLYLIADGMGGYDNGDIAASIVIDSVTTFLSNNSPELNEAVIHKAINKANLALRQYQEQNHSKLGSTLGGIIVSGNIARTFWVGDVKILHYSKAKLCFESTPHNLINELAEINNSNQEVTFSKYNHIVTRSIQGDVKKSVPSYQEILLDRDDKLYICSDGVHNLIDAQAIQHLIEIGDPNSSIASIINERLSKEAKDNASLIEIKDFDL